jgi:hypothetical protein
VPWGNEGLALSAALHGEALFTAQRPELSAPIDHLREVAEGRDDIRTRRPVLLRAKCVYGPPSG